MPRNRRWRKRYSRSKAEPTRPRPPWEIGASCCRSSTRTLAKAWPVFDPHGSRKWGIPGSLDLSAGDKAGPVVCRSLPTTACLLQLRAQDSRFRRQGTRRSHQSRLHQLGCLKRGAWGTGERRMACPGESIRLSKGGGEVMTDLLLWFVSFGIILNGLD